MFKLVGLGFQKSDFILKLLSKHIKFGLNLLLESALILGDLEGEL